MVKILIADTDVKRNSASCQFLANEKGFEIESTNDGSSTIKYELNNLGKNRHKNLEKYRKTKALSI